MDYAQSNTYMTQEQANVAAKKRLESFQFRPVSNPGIPQSKATKANHARSRSKTNSISSLSHSNSTNSLVSSQSTSEIFSSSSRPSSLVGARPRPVSHHRRRSSVSTRVESAEVMGLSIPELSTSSSDDNINFGDKDSIRRRALLALEGRSELGSNNAVVEIPNFDNSTKTASPKSPDFPVKPSPLLNSSFGIGNTLSKRDSFGKLLTSSSLKDQLHTLMEEEEEEDEMDMQTRSLITPVRSDSYLSIKAASIDRDKQQPLTPLSAGFAQAIVETPEVSVTTPSPQVQRHRPTSLVLRPLSLNSTTMTAGLPTPSATPSPRGAGAGLKSLTLSALSNDGSPSAVSPSAARRQSSLGLSPSSSPTNSVLTRRQSSSGSLSSTNSSISSKRQSISYIRSGASPTPSISLPTPGATPTSERRQSFPTSVSDSESILSVERPHSAAESEQAFLNQSHATLLARIADLERALQMCPHSRCTSTLSDYSFSPSEPPSDEMLQLVADLKSERDELTRDVEGWRQRVNDLEHAKSILERRIETERRDGWLKGEKLGLLEIEKAGLTRELKSKEAEIEKLASDMERARLSLRKASNECETLNKDLENTKCQLEEAQKALNKKHDIEAEIEALKSDLLLEKQRRIEMESILEGAGVLDTPKPAFKTPALSKFNRPVVSQLRGNVLGFTSIDSEATDVETLDERRTRIPFSLKAVEEEPEIHDNDDFDGEDELAGYEDENESDMSFMSSLRSSSTSSLFDDELPRSTSHLRITDLDVAAELRSCSPMISPIPLPNPWDTPTPPTLKEKPVTKHVKNASLSQKWTFPRSGQRSISPREAEEVDRFFGCLDDTDDTLSLDKLSDKSVFSMSLHLEEEDEEEFLPPFVLPSQKSSEFTMLLDVVMEEDEGEEEIIGEKVEGGIKFSFPSITSQPSAKQESDSTMAAPSVTIWEASEVSSVQVKSTFTTSSAVPITPPNQRSGPSISRPVVSTRIPPPSPPRFSKQQPSKPVTTASKRPTTVATFTPVPKSNATDKVKQSNDFNKKPERTIVSTPISKPKTSQAMAPSAPSKQQQQRVGLSKFGFGGRTNEDPNYVNACVSTAHYDRFATSSTPVAQVIRSSPSVSVYDRGNFEQEEDVENGTRAEGSKASSSPFDVFKSTSISSRFSLQSFTNLIPSLSWVSSSSSINSLIPHPPSNLPTNTHDETILSLSIISDNARNGKEKKKELIGYVSKEKQLAKLKERMISEGKLSMTKMKEEDVIAVVDSHSHDVEDDNFRVRRGLKTTYGTHSLGRTDFGIERCSRCSGDLILL